RAPCDSCVPQAPRSRLHLLNRPSSAAPENPSNGGESRITRSYSLLAFSRRAVISDPTRSAAPREGGPAGRMSRVGRAAWRTRKLRQGSPDVSMLDELGVLRISNLR